MKQAWRMYSSDSLDACFGTLHEVYRLTMLHDGGNKFCTMHSGVRKRKFAGVDTVNYSVDFDCDSDSD